MNIDLSDYAGEIVKIKFKAINGLGHNLYIDNINIDEAPASINDPVRSGIELYPNPLQNYTQFYFSQFLENHRLKLYDVSGKELLQENISGRFYKLSRNGLPAGILFFTLTNKSGFCIKKGKLVCID